MNSGVIVLLQLFFAFTLTACPGSGTKHSTPDPTHSGETGSPADELDGDGDGVTVEEGDCDDADPASAPGAAEDCADGVDNDCDALLDCEDEACWESEDCGELACSDGADDDGDGWVDCADEDCWGLGGCVITARSRVLGGSLTAEHRRSADGGVDATFPGSDGCDREYGYPYGAREEVTATPRDLSGTVRIDWGSGAQTCTWTLGHAALHHTHRVVHFPDWEFYSASCVEVGVVTVSSSLASLERDSFEVSEGCPARSSWFLPQELGMQEPWAWTTAAGGVWYTGDASRTGYDTYGVEGSRATWQVDALLTGATYTVTR